MSSAALPAAYGERVLVLSVEPVEITGVYGAPPGPDGFSWILEANKPTRVPYEVYRVATEATHLQYASVVKVDVTEKKDEFGNVVGTDFDLESAKRESAARLQQADDRAFQFWISGIVEDYVKRGKPVPEPDAHIQRIIARRNYDLKRYGIVPIGWAEKEKSNEVDQLKALLAEQSKQLAELKAKLGE